MKDQDTLLKLGNDRYYILATSSYTDDRTKVINNGDTFAIFDRWGDVNQIGRGMQGIYHEGTRFISSIKFRINGLRPILLSSNIKNENEIFSIDLSNPRLDQDGTAEMESLHIARSKFLKEGICYETLEISNFGIDDYTVELSFGFDSDFRDIFEIRGMNRTRHGEIHEPEFVTKKCLRLSYTGLDDIRRTTWVRFNKPAERTTNNVFIFPCRIKAGRKTSIEYSIQCQTGTQAEEPDSRKDAFAYITRQISERRKVLAHITSSNDRFNTWLERSRNDLLSLLKQTPNGLYPYAGVPWFNTAFGRDGIITAMELLWVAPEIAKGVLHYLAANQARSVDLFRDAEPGKILHETRGGEMAELDEVPFKKYYGTIDATPLFVALAGRYYHRTADRDTIKGIWQNIRDALTWIEVYGDSDNDGFIDYNRKMESGLCNQGWKDSNDSVSHENGELAEPPIALCEVQAYVYEAYVQAAYLANELGEHELTATYNKKAQQLKRQFNDAFWSDALNTYVLALDGDKNQCRVKGSNAGHCLFSGIADEDKAGRIVNTLMQDDLFCGWGIRTLSSQEKRYNPMSYHNGSVWPHDTAMVASGMARYGYVSEAIKLMEGIYEASMYMDLKRLPELFCGFLQRPGEPPTSYPVACIPQAWAVGSVYLLLQSCLQIYIDAPKRRIFFDRPRLPGFLRSLTVRNLCVPDGSFEIEFVKYKWDIGIHLINKPDGWNVIVHR